jgi:hypothetical protein
MDAAGENRQSIPKPSPEIGAHGIADRQHPRRAVQRGRGVRRRVPSARS